MDSFLNEDLQGCLNHKMDLALMKFEMEHVTNSQVINNAKQRNGSFNPSFSLFLSSLHRFSHTAIRPFRYKVMQNLMQSPIKKC